MSKQGKVWGSSKTLLKTPFVEVHLIEVLPGGYCSLHSHRHRWNAFAVISGSLQIACKTDYDLVEVTDLKIGEACTVAPGTPHQFRCSDERGAVAFEIYYPEPVSGSDIQREGKGGRKRAKSRSSPSDSEGGKARRL